MNLVGEKVTVVSSCDPTTVGRSGLVVLETAKTLVVDSGGRTIRLPKSGSVFRVSGSGAVLAGSDIAGSLEDRWKRRAA